MATILFANNATSTLAGSLSPTATTLNVAAGTGVLFPSPGPGQIFSLTLVDAATGNLNEILRVTAVNGDVFTVSRGQENTAPQSWQPGDVVANLVTAGSLAAFAQTSSITAGAFQGTDTGTNPNVVVVSSTTPALSAPATGQYFQIVKSNQGNTGPVTCTVGSSGSAVSVVYKDGSGLDAGAWPGNAAALLYYTGGVFQFLACQGNPAVRTFAAADTGTADALAANPVPAVPSLSVPFQVNIIKSAAANLTSAPTLNVSALGAKQVYRCDGTPLAPRDLPGAALIPAQWDPVLGGFRLLAPITPTQVPLIPVPGFTLYFDFQNGSDSSPGTQSSPLKTLTTSLLASASKFAVSGLTIQGRGTGPAPGLFPRLAGSVVIQGPTTSSADLVLTGANPGGGGNALTNINNNNVVTFANLTFENDGTTAHTVAVGGGAQVLATNVATTCTVNGNSNFHWTVQAGLTLNNCSAQGNMGGLVQEIGGVSNGQFNPGSVFTHTNSATYSIATLAILDGSRFTIGAGATFAGNGFVSGSQLQLGDLAIVRGNGQGNNIPGTSPGVRSQLGVYTA